MNGATDRERIETVIVGGGQAGVAAACAVVLMASVVTAVLPYVLLELRRERR